MKSSDGAARPQKTNRHHVDWSLPLLFMLGKGCLDIVADFLDTSGVVVLKRLAFGFFALLGL